MHREEGKSGYQRSGGGDPRAWALIPGAGAGRGRSGLAGHRAPAPAAVPRRGGAGHLPERGQRETFGGGQPPGTHPCSQTPPGPRACWVAPCRRARPRGVGAVATGHVARGPGGAAPSPHSRPPAPARPLAAAGAEGGTEGGARGRRRGGGRAGAVRGPGGGRRASGRWRRRARRDVRAGGAPVQGRRAQAAAGAAAAGPGAGRAAALGGRQDGRAPGAAGPRRPRRGPRPQPGPRLAARGHRGHPGREYAPAGTPSPLLPRGRPRGRPPPSPPGPARPPSPWVRPPRPLPLGGPEQDPHRPLRVLERRPLPLYLPAGLPCESCLVPGPGRPPFSRPLPPLLGICTFSEPGAWSPSTRPPPPYFCSGQTLIFFPARHFILYPHPFPGREPLTASGPLLLSIPIPAPVVAFLRPPPPNTRARTRTPPRSGASFLVLAVAPKPLCPLP